MSREHIRNISQQARGGDRLNASQSAPVGGTAGQAWGERYLMSRVAACSVVAPCMLTFLEKRRTRPRRCNSKDRRTC